MGKLSQKQQKIMHILLAKGAVQSSRIHAELIKKGEAISLVTVKRLLSQLAAAGSLIAMRAGRSTTYEITTCGRLFAEIDAKQYGAIEPDKRFGDSRYNFDLFAQVPKNIFLEGELQRLNEATFIYNERVKDLPAVIQKKELERLIIELSWKSSKIEGNTYTLLDTEKLILENTEAPGHDKKEARMILNHKDAFTFVHENPTLFRELTRVNLEKLHAILVKDLGVDGGLRTKPVGVLGSKYQPLDNIHQITEAVLALGQAVSRMDTPYGKALIALLGVSYIQAFADGNKRTARLMANALLVAHGCAPLSYRSVDENEYREAMLVFYEINSLAPFKKIFIEQYEFAARNYAVK